MRIRELARDIDVPVLVADRFPNYSICGLPYLLSGEVADWRHLAHRSRDELETTGMRLMLEHEAFAIDPTNHVVQVRTPGDAHTLGYDRLIIATGAVPVRPPLPGVDLPGVHVLHTMDDALQLQGMLNERAVDAAVIVGAGYIGLEMAEALLQRGMRVTIVEQAPEVLPTVDPWVGTHVRTALVSHGATVRTGSTVAAIETAADGLCVVGERGLAEAGRLVLVSVGVRPAAELATAAGAHVGERGAIKVDQHLATNLPGTWAAGDCAETYHRLLQRAAYLPLGTTAHKQGRVAGENAIGGLLRFEGALGTQVVKVFDVVAARTGLRDPEAHQAGLVPLTIQVSCNDHNAYYPGANRLHIAMTGDRHTGQLLGVQIVGHRASAVAKRIDTAAAALHAGQAVDELNELDLSYSPPLGSPWDPLQQAAQQWRLCADERH